jgi:hypothetical protein
LGALAAVIVVVGVISVLASSGGSSSASSGDASSSTDTGFRFAPASGPIGTNIRVKSSEPCPGPPSGWSDVAVEVVLHDPRVEEQTLDGDVNATDLTLNSDRSWDGEISVPDGATEGTLELRASCLGTDPAGNLSAFHEYDSQYFELSS